MVSRSIGGAIGMTGDGGPSGPAFSTPRSEAAPRRFAEASSRVGAGTSAGAAAAPAGAAGRGRAVLSEGVFRGVVGGRAGARGASARERIEASSEPPGPSDGARLGAGESVDGAAGAGGRPPRVSARKRSWISLCSARKSSCALATAWNSSSAGCVGLADHPGRSPDSPAWSRVPRPDPAGGVGAAGACPFAAAVPRRVPFPPPAAPTAPWTDPPEVPNCAAMS